MLCLAFGCGWLRGLPWLRRPWPGSVRWFCRSSVWGRLHCLLWLRRPWLDSAGGSAVVFGVVFGAGLGCPLWLLPTTPAGRLKLAANFWFQTQHPAGPPGPKREAWRREWQQKLGRGMLDKARSSLTA